MTDREAMQQALEALEYAAERIGCPDDDDAIGVARKALRERLAQPEHEFIEHHGDDEGWSEWVCPDPKGYLMKCCDCGLVHEAEFGVVRYKSETEREDCDRMDDPNLQAVFRMRRSEQWSPEDTAHRAGGMPMAQSEQCQYPDCKCATENPCLKGLAQPQRTHWDGCEEVRREWVGLTEEEIALVCGECAASAHRADDISYARAIEAALREKNT